MVSPSTRTTDVDLLTASAIDALRRGDKPRAQRLLTEATQLDPESKKAWLWLAGATDTRDDRARYLERVLALDPQNEMARKGLQKLQEAAQDTLPSTAKSPDQASPEPARAPALETRPGPAAPAAVQAASPGEPPDVPAQLPPAVVAPSPEPAAAAVPASRKAWPRWLSRLFGRRETGA